MKYRWIRIFITVATLGLPFQSFANEVRFCRAVYQWETVGGTIGPEVLEEFRARGTCGNRAAANLCRERARAAAWQCIGTQWERRWSHHPLNSDGTQNVSFDRNPPEACVNAAKVEGYSLEKNCVKRRGDPHLVDRDHVCMPGVHPTNIVREVPLATRGDIKSAVEADVCCLYDNGTHFGANETDVHVKITAFTVGAPSDTQQICKGSRVLADDYQIDCKRVRAEVCKGKVDVVQ